MLGTRAVIVDDFAFEDVKDMSIVGLCSFYLSSVYVLSQLHRVRLMKQ